MMIRSKVSAILCTFNLVTIYEIEVCCYQRKTITVETISALVRINHLSYYLQFFLPRLVSGIEL